LIDDAKGPISFAREGTVFVFRRWTVPSELLVANADGSAVKKLATCTEGDIWLQPAWSPDRSVIVVPILSRQDNKARLYETALDDGQTKLLSPDTWATLSSLSWLPDGSGLILTGRDPETRLFQIWLISYPDGKRRRITNDLSSYGVASITADGTTLVGVQSARTSNLWVAPDGNADAAKKITFDTGKDEGLSGLSWTQDGRIVHTERNAGATDLWIVNKDGSEITQLTKNAGKNFYPNVTPDGRYIVFVSDRSGISALWRIDIDGRNPLQLTNFAASFDNPSISSDSKSVFFSANVSNAVTLWKISVDGGTPVQLTQDCAMPVVNSRDEIICQYGALGSNSVVKLALFSANGGPPERLLDLPDVIKTGLVKWSAKEDALIYRDSRNRTDNVWSQSLNGGPPKQVTDFKADQIFGFDWSRDGKYLVLARGRAGTDVVTITNFR
jgi:Tol biopolymer transport system component